MKVFQTAAIALTGLALTGLATRSSAWTADPQLLGLLMPDAKVIAGVQLSQVEASPFGQFVLSQAGPIAQLDQIKAATGFDPRTDMTDVVAGSAGPGGGLVTGHGAFQPTRITNLAMIAGATVESYRGINLISGANRNEAVVAFLDGTTVVLGNPVLVKGAVDRWIGGRVTGVLTAKATEASATSQAWAVASGLSDLQPKTGVSGQPVPPEMQMVQNILNKIGAVSGGVNFSDTITLTGQAQTSSPEDAQALVDVFQFVTAMAGSKAPIPAMPTVSAYGSAVKFTLTLTEQQAEQLFRPAVAIRAAVQR